MDVLTERLRREWNLVCSLDRHGATARRWAAAEPALASITTLDDALDRCHDEHDREAAHSTFAALCRLASDDEVARLAVLRALVPAICSITSRYRHFVGPGSPFATRDELASHVASSISVRLLSPRDLGPQPVRRLMSYASWDVRVAHRKDRAGLTQPTSWERPDEEIAVLGDGRSGVELAASAIRHAYETGQLSAMNARILFRSNVLHDEIHAIARDERVHASTVSRRHMQAVASAQGWATVA